MDIFTAAFFGHRYISHPLQMEKRLEQLIHGLLLKKEYVELLVGRDGEFDQLVSSVALRCKQTIRNDNCTLVWVMPYETAKYRRDREAYCGYYDEIEICSNAAVGYFKEAYQIRNRQMVDRSDLVVFCVEHNSGGAYQTLCYAKRQGKSIINLAKDE